MSRKPKAIANPETLNIQEVTEAQMVDVVRSNPARIVEKILEGWRMATGFILDAASDVEDGKMLAAIRCNQGRRKALEDLIIDLSIEHRRMEKQI